MEFIFFMFGILFSQALTPIIDGFVSLCLVWIEAKKAMWSDTINQINIKIRQDTALAEQIPPQRTIGFGRSEEEDGSDEV